MQQILLACVIVAAAALEDQLDEESRWRSKGWDSSWRKGDLIDRSWSKGDLRGWNKGSWNKGDLGWGKGCIDCGRKGLDKKGWSKGRWARSAEEEDDMIDEESKLRSHGGLSRGNLGGNKKTTLNNKKW